MWKRLVGLFIKVLAWFLLLETAQKNSACVIFSRLSSLHLNFLYIKMSVNNECSSINQWQQRWQHLLHIVSVAILGQRQLPLKGRIKKKKKKMSKIYTSGDQMEYPLLWMQRYTLPLPLRKPDPASFFSAHDSAETQCFIL